MLLSLCHFFMGHWDDTKYRVVTLSTLMTTVNEHIEIIKRCFRKKLFFLGLGKVAFR